MLFKMFQKVLQVQLFSIAKHRTGLNVVKTIWPSSKRPIYLNFTKYSDTKINEQSVFDLTDYTDKQIFHHRVKELEPSAPSFKQILGQFETANEVLNFAQENHNRNILSDDDLIFYYGKLNALLVLKHKPFHLKKTSEIDFSQNLDISSEATHLTDSFSDMELAIGPDLQVQNHILNDERFQLLLKRTILTCQLLPARDLSYFYQLFLIVGMPVNSSTFQHLIKNIQSKINEMSITDIRRCIKAQIRNCKANDPVFILLKQGFEMHMENLALDQELFIKSCSHLHLRKLLDILQYGAYNGSVHLKKMLWRACYLNLKHRDYQLTQYESATILRLYRKRGYYHAFLVKTAAQTLTKHKDTLKPWQKSELENFSTKQ